MFCKFYYQDRNYYMFLNKKNGFTLIELIVVIFVTSLLIFSISSLLIKTFSGSNQQFLADRNVSKAVSTATNFVNDLRNATYGADGSYPIFQAGASEIIFYSNTASSTVANRIRYYILNNVLYKGVTAASGSPLYYNLASEITKPIQTDVANSDLFYYYSGDYNGLGLPMDQPINLNNIKYIKINLNILKQTKSQSNETFLVSSGAAIRNLKDNLGN